MRNDMPNHNVEMLTYMEHSILPALLRISKGDCGVYKEASGARP